MTKIKRLTEEGRDLVRSHDEFEDGDEVYTLSEQLEPHVETFDVKDASIDLDRLSDVIDRSMDVFDPSVDTERSAMDSMLAPFVHQCYEVPPRTAGRIGVWQYLTLVEFPEYVVYRWENQGGLKEKLLGSQKDLYSNQIARLWWGAHLTYDCENDHYWGVHKLFNKQRLANYVLDSEFRRCRPAALAFVDVLHSTTGTIIDEVGPRFNQSLSTYQMESRHRNDFTDQLETIVEFVMS